MKILITGISGFVASYLAKLCIDNGDEVVGTFRWQEDLTRLEEFKDKINIEEVELTDLSNVIRCINKHRPDVISHLAAQSWVPSSMDNPIYTMKNNVESTLNVMEAVRCIREIDDTQIDSNPVDYVEEYEKYNPLIHICSSSEFYGKVDRKELPITENHKANPGNVYGVSKTAGDFLAQLYEKYYDMNILITRMFTHTGAKRSMMSAEVYYAKCIAELEKSGGDVIKIADEAGMNSLRTWADVRDAVKNYRELFINKRTGVYNISGQTEKTVQEALDYLLSISKLDKSKIKFEVAPEFIRKINVDKQIVDISKYKNNNNWYNEISFEELMQSLLDYWRVK